MEDINKLLEAIRLGSSSFNLKQPLRETPAYADVDNMGFLIEPEFRKHNPNLALKVAADATNRTTDLFNTGNGVVGDIMFGKAGTALSDMSYGYNPKINDAVDLGLLGVGPFVAGVKGLASGAKLINDTNKFRKANEYTPDELKLLMQRRVVDEAVPMSSDYANRADTFGGRKIDTDIARELFPEYNNANSLVNKLTDTVGSRYRAADVHTGASALSKLRYEELLNAPVPSGIKNKVTFTAGSSGAGKSKGLLNLPKRQQPDFNSKVYYDTNFSDFNKAKSKIDEAIKSGDGKTPVDIFYVNRGLEDAFKGTINRTANQAENFGSGRIVDIDTMLMTNLGSLKTIKQLDKSYKNNPLVNIKVVDNTGDKPFISSIKNLPRAKSKAAAEKDLFKILREERLNPESKLTKEAYERILNGRPDPIADIVQEGQTLGDLIYGY